MYQATYINPIYQLGRIEYELLLVDDAGILPDQRIPKSFPDTSTQTELDAEANRTIAVVRASQAVAPQAADTDIPIDVPADEVLPE